MENYKELLHYDNNEGNLYFEGINVNDFFNMYRLSINYVLSDVIREYLVQSNVKGVTINKTESLNGEISVNGYKRNDMDLKWSINVSEELYEEVKFKTFEFIYMCLNDVANMDFDHYSSDCHSLRETIKSVIYTMCIGHFQAIYPSSRSGYNCKASKTKVEKNDVLNSYAEFNEVNKVKTLKK